MSGELRLPAGEGKNPFIDADDIAEVAVATLTDPQHNCASYELRSGPRALSFAEVAEELTQATGRTISYTPLSTEEYVNEQIQEGFPAEFAELLAGTFGSIAAGNLEVSSPDVESVLGKPARDFQDLAKA